YVWRTPDLRLLLCAIALVGLVTFGNFSIVGPLLAKLTFHGDAGTFAVMSSAMGLGSLVGSLFSATRAQPSIALCLGSCVCFGAFIALAAAAPNLAVALPMFVGVGALMMVFLSTMTATVQLAAAP